MISMEIRTIERVHSIGHSLKDVKTTLNYDVKIDVAGVKISGMQGEVLNIPQWAGRVLAENNLAGLDAPDMIQELKQALSKEKMVGEHQLSTLDPHFYIKLKETMRDLNRDDYDRIESVMLELFRMRRGKIVKHADSIKLYSELYGKLTVEESVFYKSIHDNSVEFERQIRGKRDE